MAVEGSMVWPVFPALCLLEVRINPGQVTFVETQSLAVGKEGLCFSLGMVVAVLSQPSSQRLRMSLVSVQEPIVL